METDLIYKIKSNFFSSLKPKAYRLKSKTKNQERIKRTFDIFLAIIALLIFGWLILVLIFIAQIDTGKGLFLQTRVGQFGKPFTIYKIRSMHFYTARISNYGKFLRKCKFDELPQLLNILIGNMSFVGPRPDVPGYYDILHGEARKLLELKPGLCSRAALKYYNEEILLAKQPDSKTYNDDVIFPDKVQMNLHYYYKRSFTEDLKIIYEFLCLAFWPRSV